MILPANNTVLWSRLLLSPTRSKQLRRRCNKNIRCIVIRKLNRLPKRHALRRVGDCRVKHNHLPAANVRLRQLNRRLAKMHAARNALADDDDGDDEGGGAGDCRRLSF